MEEEDGFGLGIRGMAQVEDISIRALAAPDGGARRSGNVQAVGAQGDFSVITDSDAGLEAPDIRPPRAGWRRAQGGALLGQGLVTGRLWGGAQFAVDFMLIGMREQLLEQGIGAT